MATRGISDLLLAAYLIQFFYFLNPNSKPLVIFCGCTAQFVSDLVENTEDRFSHDAAQITRQESKFY